MFYFGLNLFLVRYNKCLRKLFANTLDVFLCGSLICKISVAIFIFQCARTLQHPNLASQTLQFGVVGWNSLYARHQLYRKTLSSRLSLWCRLCALLLLLWLCCWSSRCRCWTWCGIYDGKCYDEFIQSTTNKCTNNWTKMHKMWKSTSSRCKILFRMWNSCSSK